MVSTYQPLQPDFVELMSNGVEILGTVTRKCEVEQLGECRFRIVLTQGLNRQIRRMCEQLGYHVRKLKRIRIMNIKLDVDPGEWRDLTQEELDELNLLLKDSDKNYVETDINDDID